MAANLGCQRQCGEVAIIPIRGGVAVESDGDGVTDMNLLQVPEGGWGGEGLEGVGVDANSMCHLNEMQLVPANGLNMGCCCFIL